jgi:pSer/pThr/pTyr-binding forkhead associated (FHA) protein
MDLKLRVVEGKNAGQEIAVNGKKFLIGRSEDCHLRPGSELISRHHCVILIEEGYVGIRDFGSKNGTYVNDERIAGERELKAGDRLTIGPLRFEVHVAHRIGGKKQPPVGDVKEAVARTAHNAAKDPLDVAEWLTAEGGSDTHAGSPGDTYDASLKDTDAVSLSTTQTLVPESIGAEQPDDAEHAHGEKPGKKGPGKLPPVATKDSQDAAAAMLSRLRKRR